MAETSTVRSTEVLDQYVAFWNAENGHRRRSIAEAIFATPISYHAPIGLLTGPEELINFRNRFIDQAGDASLVPGALRRPITTGPGCCGRSSWQLVSRSQSIPT